MRTSITIRNVPVEVRDELAARAARSGRSLQEYLLHELSDVVAYPEPAELINSARQRVQRTGSELGPDDILGHLDADRK